MADQGQFSTAFGLCVCVWAPGPNQRPAYIYNQSHSLGSIYLRGLFVYTYKHITNDFLLNRLIFCFSRTIPLVPSLPLLSAYIYTPETMHGTSRFISQSTSLHRFCRFCTATSLLFKQDAVPLMVMVSQPRNTLIISIWLCVCIGRWKLEGWGDAGMGV